MTRLQKFLWIIGVGAIAMAIAFLTIEEGRKGFLWALGTYTVASAIVGASVFYSYTKVGVVVTGIGVLIAAIFVEPIGHFIFFAAVSGVYGYIVAAMLTTPSTKSHPQMSQPVLRSRYEQLP